MGTAVCGDGAGEEGDWHGGEMHVSSRMQGLF